MKANAGLYRPGWVYSCVKGVESRTPKWMDRVPDLCVSLSKTCSILVHLPQSDLRSAISLMQKCNVGWWGHLLVRADHHNGIYVAAVQCNVREGKIGNWKSKNFNMNSGTNWGSGFLSNESGPSYPLFGNMTAKTTDNSQTIFKHRTMVENATQPGGFWKKSCPGNHQRARGQFWRPWA